eukprot:scaffold16382_cov35-Tisochrysis_lutea.AAC.4
MAPRLCTSLAGKYATAAPTLTPSSQGAQAACPPAQDLCLEALNPNSCTFFLDLQNSTLAPSSQGTRAACPPAPDHSPAPASPAGAPAPAAATPAPALPLCPAAPLPLPSVHAFPLRACAGTVLANNCACAPECR